MLRGQTALEESRYDEAYAFLSTALAAFRTAYSLQSTAAALAGAHRRGGERGGAGRGGEMGDTTVDCDSYQRGEGDADVAGGAGDSVAGREGKESEGTAGSDGEGGRCVVEGVRDKKCVISQGWLEWGEECVGEALVDLLGGEFVDSELACEAEMRELALLLEQVKQAEAASLLRVAQVSSPLLGQIQRAPPLALSLSLSLPLSLSPPHPFPHLTPRFSLLPKRARSRKCTYHHILTHPCLPLRTLFLLLRLSGCPCLSFEIGRERLSLRVRVFVCVRARARASERAGKLELMTLAPRSCSSGEGKACGKDGQIYERRPDAGLPRIIASPELAEDNVRN